MIAISTTEAEALPCPERYTAAPSWAVSCSAASYCQDLWIKIF